MNFTAYWNQVTPENGGKWGSVEGQRNVMSWADLDAAYNLAKANGFPFRMHTLVWGNQQPAWIESLPPAEQLAEIQQWFAAVAARYPDIDFIDVVNEPLHDPPRGATNGNYIEALGGDGPSGWEWVLRSFRMARQYFPHAKLGINEYSVTNNTADMQRYIGIIQLLQAEGLIDTVGVQGHAFSWPRRAFPSTSRSSTSTVPRTRSSSRTTRGSSPCSGSTRPSAGSRSGATGPAIGARPRAPTSFSTTARSDRLWSGCRTT